MNKIALQEIINEQNGRLAKLEFGIQREVLNVVQQYANLPHAVVILGIRRSGKSTLLRQILRTFYPEGVYYFSFEDERLLEFSIHDFNLLYESFVELYGNRKVFFLDEIQNVQKWESFVRRMQDQGFKFYLTGSNASLLSKELGKKLTGRHVTLKVLPFSFREFLNFADFAHSKQDFLDTAKRGLLKRKFNQYLHLGGMPEWLKYRDISLLKNGYEDILYRDIVTRHDIKSTKELRELSLFLLSNVANLFSYNRLKNLLHLGSPNTVKNFVSFLEDSFLFYTINKFSFSIAEQTFANKKIYCVDNGIIEAVAFKFSQKAGFYLENLVFLELYRRGCEIYYYKTTNNLEVDFILREGTDIVKLIQVTEHITINTPTRDRELQSLITAMQETKLNHGLILTLDQTDELRIDDKIITVQPVYQWLLQTK